MRRHNVGIHGKGEECWWELVVKPGREKQVRGGGGAGAAGGLAGHPTQPPLLTVLCRCPDLC